MIDWARTTELHEEIGAEDFEEILGLFLEEVEAVLDRLGQSADPATLGDDLHFLKGSALNVGFSALAELCAAGEATANAGNWADVDMSEITDCYKQSKTLFMASYRDRLAA